MSFATRAANLVIRFVVVENAIFIISDQSSCCQLVNHLFEQQREKRSAWLLITVIRRKPFLKPKYNLHTPKWTPGRCSVWCVLTNVHSRGTTEQSLHLKCPSCPSAATSTPGNDFCFLCLQFCLFYKRPFYKFNLFQKFSTVLLRRRWWHPTPAAAFTLRGRWGSPPSLKWRSRADLQRAVAFSENPPRVTTPDQTAVHGGSTTVTTVMSWKMISS